MCCLGCCEQSVRLVDLVPYVNSLFKEICVECMVILIGINNFRDPLVNWRLTLTYDDPSACWFCVYLLPHHLSFVLRELSWLGVFSVQPSIIRKKIFLKKFPKYSWNGQYILSIFWSMSKYLVTSVLYVILKWMKFILFNNKTNL